MNHCAPLDAHQQQTFGINAKRSCAGIAITSKSGFAPTDGQKASADAAGVTTFWVLRSRKYKDVPSAAAVITKDVATMVANLIAAEGEELATWLEKSGLVTPGQGTRVLDSDRLRNLFFFHCVVMEGHLPNSCLAR